MTEQVEDIADMELPYRRRAQVRVVEFDSGMKMVRLILREGTRITQIDLDGEAASTLAGAMGQAAEKL